MKPLTLLCGLAILLTACAASMTPTTIAGSGVIFIDGSELRIAESYPVQISLHVIGNLPTPCNFLHYSYQIGSQTDRFRIDVTAWSESDPDLNCAQVLQPFDESFPIPMEGAVQGTYGVWLNGEKVGEFDYPA